MKKFIYSFLLVFSIFMIFSLKTWAIEGNRYFTKTNINREEIEEIINSNNGKLISYENNIVVANFNSSNKKIVINGLNFERDKSCATLSIRPYNNELYEYSDINLKAIDWFSAYYNNIKGNGSVVAILDSGCNVNHEDLSGQIVGTYNAVNDSTDVTDKNGHGTHIAGIIAAKDNKVGIIGVAPETKLFIVKVDDEYGVEYYSNIIKGLYKCIERGDINVINLSLGGTVYSELFKEAIKDCNDHGILIVSAAGNEGSSTINCYPAAFGYGLSVGWYNSENKKLSDYSNYGSYVNIVAPGQDITSSCGNYYVGSSGSSMATSFVSGAAALLYGEQSFSKTSSGVNQAKEIILAAKNNKTYKSSLGHQIVGGLNIGNIFNIIEKKPKTPKIKITKQKDTGQRIVTITGTGTIYYGIDEEDPKLDSKLYTGPIRFDGPDEYYLLTAVAVNSKGFSNIAEADIELPEDVISQKKLESVELYINKINKSKTYKVVKGKKYKIKIENIGKNIKANKFTWSSNSRMVTVDKDGVITVNKKAVKGKKIIIRGKLGDITKKLNIVIN